ncbi:MAG: transposase [Oscillospiraceae bacterium]|nr:transposase [Oscillospiraceae bacterium]
MDLPKRKPNRLQYYDYSTPGAYFITICTSNRKCFLWDTVGASIARPQTPQLSDWGVIVDQAIRDIPEFYPAIAIDHYVVMPNHIHLLLRIQTDGDGRPMVAPTISRVVQQLKGIVTKQIGVSIWQKLFHDHVIRGEQDYLKIWEYIDSNPARWKDDCFYQEELP